MKHESEIRIDPATFKAAIIRPCPVIIPPGAFAERLLLREYEADRPTGRWMASWVASYRTDIPTGLVVVVLMHPPVASASIPARSV